MRKLLTVVIPTRNSENTILRALESVVNAKAAQIIIIDDNSSDNTVRLLNEQNYDNVTIIKRDKHTTLGALRQCGVESVNTEFLMWVDSDDAISTSRIQRALAAFEDGYDVYIDSANFIGADSTESKLLIPDFLTSNNLCRLFERNYLPVTGPITIKTALARSIGYDPSFETAEDYDLWLKIIMSNASVFIDRHCGYYIYHTENSTSRDLSRQNTYVRKALEKYSFDEIKAIYDESNMDKIVTDWALVIYCINTAKYSYAECLLRKMQFNDMELEKVSEPNGPNQLKTGCRYWFALGTIDLLLNHNIDAIGCFKSALQYETNAETLNNLGVAYRRVGEEKKAVDLFIEASNLYPNYSDARKNLNQLDSQRITKVPLRLLPSRDIYN